MGGGRDALLETPCDEVLAALTTLEPAPLVESSCLAIGGLVIERAAKRIAYWWSEVSAMMHTNLEQLWPGRRVERAPANVIA